MTFLSDHVPASDTSTVVTADNYIRIGLGMVEPGADFTIQFVNTTNTSQVFAEVKEIKIEAGIREYLEDFSHAPIV